MGINREFLTPTPHPEYRAFTVREIQEDLERIEGDLSFAKEHGADSLFIQWLVHERDLALGELARLNGQNLTSDYRNPPSEVRFEVNAGELRAKAKKFSDPLLTCLPVLSLDNFVVKSWSHLLASYPKGGKTELVIRIISDWQAERVLYFTEEAESVWKLRLSELPDRFHHVTLNFALALSPGEILERIRNGPESVVIIDTVRNLLGLKDEKDNSEVAKAILPFVSVARTSGKTIIFLHHDRKGGGEHGEGITGGHAFLGVVDIGLELKRDSTDRRRLLRGWGRVIEVPSVLYEKQDDGAFVAIGSPSEVALKEVKKRVLSLLTHFKEANSDFHKTKEIREALDDPKPSLDQVSKGLDALAREGRAERDPPMSGGQLKGVSYRWRLSENLTSDTPPYRSEVRLDAESKKEEGRWTSEL